MNQPNVAEPLRWLGETVGFWVQTLIFLASAFGGIWIILARGTQEKRRATVDLVIEQLKDEKLRDAQHLVARLHESGESNFAKYLADTESLQYKAIMRVLNMHEFSASGIRQGAFDEMTYKRVRYSTVRKDWISLCGFVMEIRKQRKSPTLFQEFQWLSNRWEAEPLIHDHPQSLMV
jgi:hypothetical protein